MQFVRFRKWLIQLPRRQKQLVALCADVVMALAATWLAFTLRLDTEHFPVSYQWVPYGLAAVLFIPFFIRFGLYRAIFRYSGASSLSAVAGAVALHGALYFSILVFWQFPGVPRSVGILQPILFFSLVFGSRVLASQLLKGAGRSSQARHVLIYGAGEAGAQASEALSSSPEYKVYGFLDDDRTKHNRRVQGYPVLDPAEVADAIEEYGITDVLIALPSASVTRRREIINGLLNLQVRVRSIPGILDLARGAATIDEIAELQIIDLLDRAPIASTLPPDAMTGKTVLVTGAGGSIGSELCRQILLMRPRELVLFEHSEFGLYTIDEELRSTARARGIQTTITPCLGSVRDERRVTSVFETARPELVYHAAAYKHVPLVESNPLEAATNNVLGTQAVARAAQRTGCQRFTLISTDKAVRPTNFMGATKRLAEQVIQSAASEPGQKTIFSMVRFGNVLGSSGSVVPLFRRQVATGGPVTVTHPEVVRYFMTIPEAVGLVLHSSQMARGGEVFVLDMGEPVKIVDLAHKIIRLSGRTERTPDNPGGEVEITYVGLRPGEKLYEELLIGDDPQPTANPHIMMAREGFVTGVELEGELAQLRRAVEAEDVDMLAAVLSRTVAGFRRDQTGEETQRKPNPAASVVAG